MDESIWNVLWIACALGLYNIQLFAVCGSGPPTLTAYGLSLKTQNLTHEREGLKRRATSSVPSIQQVQLQGLMTGTRGSIVTLQITVGTYVHTQHFTRSISFLCMN